MKEKPITITVSRVLLHTGYLTWQWLRPVAVNNVSGYFGYTTAEDAMREATKRHPTAEFLIDTRRSQ